MWIRKLTWLLLLAACGDSSNERDDEARDSIMDAGDDSGSALVDGGGEDASSVVRDPGTASDSAVGGGDGGLATSLPFSAKNVPAEVAIDAPGDMVFSTAACSEAAALDTATGKIEGCRENTGELRFRFVDITQPDTSLGELSAALVVTRRFVIEQGMRVTVTGNRPLIVVALQEARINGQLQASAMQGTARGGGFGVTEDGQNGLGPGGGGRPNGSSGAGGAGFCGLGGAGGMDNDLIGAGGRSYGSPENVPLIGGSSGGMVSTYGSAGGGAIQISAGERIEVGALGGIDVGGGGAGWSANGGGSGGAILLEAPEVRVLGRLTANGGGGSASISRSGSSGADGSNDDQPALGGRVEGFPSGGNGAAGANINGGPGEPSPEGSTRAGGGGGGGAGRIRVNVSEGEPELAGALISPAQSTPCFTIGTL